MAYPSHPKPVGQDRGAQRDGGRGHHEHSGHLDGVVGQNHHDAMTKLPDLTTDDPLWTLKWASAMTRWRSFAARFSRRSRTGLYVPLLRLALAWKT